MQTENSRIEILFKRYLDQSISREEYNEFWQLLNEQNIEALSPQLQTLWIQTEGIAPVYTDEEWNHKLKALIQKAEEEDRMKLPGAMVVPMSRRRVFKWIAVACIILLLGITTYTVISKRSEKSPPQVAKTNDIPAPSNTRAVITLADGSKVYLDSLGNGVIAQENNVNVVKNADGSIIYSHEDAKAQGEIAYNTLFNPRGSKVISLTLSDGTKVWLNSESSLKYPTAFTSNTREVEITGEAYFEVKHNSEQPFKVHLPNGSIVEDVGTAFNVNAYSDEAAIKTTLIEGSVIVRGETSDVKLVPGDQALQIPQTRVIRVQDNVDLDEVMAWKNGQFNLRSTDFAMLMRQVARWYDVDVEYKGSIPQNKFGGSLSRDLSLGTLLKALQQSGINAQLEGRKIVIQ